MKVCFLTLGWLLIMTRILLQNGLIYYIFKVQSQEIHISFLYNLLAVSYYKTLYFLVYPKSYIKQNACAIIWKMRFFPQCDFLIFFRWVFTALLHMVYFWGKLAHFFIWQKRPRMTSEVAGGLLVMVKRTMPIGIFGVMRCWAWTGGRRVVASFVVRPVRIPATGPTVYR